MDVRALGEAELMSDRNLGATPTLLGRETPLEDLVRAYIQSVATAAGDGTYASNAQNVLENWLDFCEPRRIETVEDVDKNALADYAAHLKRRVGAAKITGHTANAYYDIVSACLGYGVRRDLLDTNPARKEAAEQELPETTSKQTRQYWTRETRESLYRWADWRAESALDDGWMDGRTAIRDHAFVALIGYSGVRGSEILRNSKDSDRNGIRWKDVDFEKQLMVVLGKSRGREEVYISERVIRPLTNLRRRQDPPTDEWPVFATQHLRSLYDTARDALAGEVPDLQAQLTPDTIDDFLREHEVPPPSITTEGGRRILKRLSAESGITEDGEYPKPHGGRRGVGYELYLEDAELSQDILRHESIETTKESYAEVDTRERGREADEIL